MTSFTIFMAFCLLFYTMYNHFIYFSVRGRKKKRFLYNKSLLLYFKPSKYRVIYLIHLGLFLNCNKTEKERRREIGIKMNIWNLKTLYLKRTCKSKYKGVWMHLLKGTRVFFFVPSWNLHLAAEMSMTNSVKSFSDQKNILWALKIWETKIATTVIPQENSNFPPWNKKLVICKQDETSRSSPNLSVSVSFWCRPRKVWIILVLTSDSPHANKPV